MPNALITGASTGIGRETALYFADRGYRVFAGVRKPEAVEPLPGVILKRLDVDRDESVTACVAEVLNEVDSVDVLVNNAGIGFGAAVELAPLDRIRAMFETNFYGAIRMTQAVLPGMRARHSGMIVNVTSIMGRITLGCHGMYSATKYALEAVSQSLAIEARPFGIGVAIIEPGVILTPIWGKAEAAMPDEHPYQAAVGRLMRLFGSQLESGAPAGIVARAIYDAVEERGERLSYPVGLDAEALIAGRDRMSAAEWVELMAEPDDERFTERAAAVFGTDLYNPPSLYARSMARSAANEG